jgi:pyruvate/2-oxoglutarate dehydrogenase complex dihydrolipoamide dehydrogenase (E3) component
MHTDQGQSIITDKVLIAAGRAMHYDSLKLANAGVRVNKDGSIAVNNYLQTSRRNIYAIGDCNGHALLSHAAMHQGMIAVMNSMMSWPMKQNL